MTLKTLLDNKRFKTSLVFTFWFALVCFPIMVIQINMATRTVIWRWGNLPGSILLGFFGSYAWNTALEHFRSKARTPGKLSRKYQELRLSLDKRSKIKNSTMIATALVLLILPFVTSMYNTSMLSTALIYVVLGLGLNIIIGYAGLLHLGYGAFFAIGAYTYALLFKYFQINFWLALPLGGITALIFGLIIGIPVLRLRGDYLAIVTLAFGEIVRIFLTNLGEITGGPDGISRIARPAIFGLSLRLQGSINLTYYLALAMVIFTIFFVKRLENSRIGRAWEAMREDEIAARSMGINIMKNKLIAFALGSMWAGFAGVLMAAKSTKVTPDAFGLMESITILCIVVLGGMGSIPGVLLGTFVFKVVMEYFRVFAIYRMLIFGAILIIMMVFKPDGLISKKRSQFAKKIKAEEAPHA